MSIGPLISDSEKDKHKTRDRLRKELSELRALLAAKTEDLAGSERIVRMLDGITEPVLVLDDASQVVYANSAAARLLAKDGEAIEGRSLWDLYPKGQGTLFYNAYEKARKARSTGKFREMHRQLGKWFEVYLYPVPGGITVLFNDITVSRQMEELPRLALTLLHNLKDNVFLMRADGRLFHVNTETQYSLGYTSEELHKMSILDVVPPSYANEWKDILDRIRQHGSMTFESRLRARDGHEFPVEVYANYIELYGSHYYTISARDITERKQAGQARALLASIVDTSHEAIVSITPEGVITSWNRGAEKLYGYMADEAIGNHAAMLAPPDRQTEMARNLEKLRNDGKSQYHETVRQRKDGTLIDISLTLSPIVDSSGAFVGSSAIVHDITERRRNELALKESEANLSQAQRMAHIGNWTWDTKKDRVYGSDEFYRIFGMPRQDYITYGQFIDTINPEDRDSVNMAVDTTLHKGEYYKIDYRVIRPEGAEHIVHAEGEVHLDVAGQPDRMFGTVQDVTERKKAEEILEKYRLFSENAHDIVLFVRRDGRILEANAAAVKTYGYTYEELLSLSIYDLRASDIGYHIDEQMDMAYNNGILFEAVHRRKDGSDFPVEVSSQGKIINGQRVLLSVIRDITERKHAEKALRESEEHYRTLFTGMNEGFALCEIICDETGAPSDYRILEVNAAYEMQTGLRAVDVQGKRVRELFPDVESSWIEILGEVALTGEPRRFEHYNHNTGRHFEVFSFSPASGQFAVLLVDITERKTAEEALRESKEWLRLALDSADAGVWEWDLKTNKNTWSDELWKLYGLQSRSCEPSYESWRVTIHPEDREMAERAVQEAASEGTELNFEYRVLGDSGNVRWLMSRGRPVLDTNGQPVRYIGIVLDVTERKQAEEALQVAKAQAELYVDLMGHDINNMNQVAMASLELALMDLEQDGKLDASGIPLIEKSLESLSSSSQLIRNVQKLQRASTEGISLKAINATALLERVIHEFRQAPEKELTIGFSRTGDCMVSADELLEDVFVNLIGNAIKHSRADGPLLIGISADSVVEQGKKYCWFTIDDNGPGIPDETKDRLFRRFSRGATKARGSGLGLYLVKTLVKHYGGDIRVEDRVPGDYSRGARFVVTIPSAE